MINRLTIELHRKNTFFDLASLQYISMLDIVGPRLSCGITLLRVTSVDKQVESVAKGKLLLSQLMHDDRNWQNTCTVLD